MNKIRLSATIAKSISRGLLSNFGTEEAKPGEEDPGRRIGRSMASPRTSCLLFDLPSLY